MTTAARSLAGRRRQRTGRTFESSLEALHQMYALRGLGWLQKQYPRTIYTPKGMVQAPGASAPDYIGVVAMPIPQAISGRPVGVCFDAKVLGKGREVFHYPEDELHQVRTMLTLTRTGLGHGFVLVLDRRFDVAFLIHREPHLLALLGGNAIMLRSIAGRGAKARLRSPLRIVRYVAGLGYDWRKALIEELTDAPHLSEAEQDQILPMEAR